MKFLKENWFLILLVILALAAATICIFAPIAAISTLTISLALTPAFIVLGTFAAPTATLVIALTAAAAVFATGGIIKGLGLFIDWLVSLCCRRDIDDDEQSLLNPSSSVPPEPLDQTPDSMHEPLLDAFVDEQKSSIESPVILPPTTPTPPIAITKRVRFYSSDDETIAEDSASTLEKKAQRSVLFLASEKQADDSSNDENISEADVIFSDDSPLSAGP